MTELSELLNRIGEYTDLDRLAAALTVTPVAGAAPMPVAEQEVWLSAASPDGLRRRAREAPGDLEGQRADVAAAHVRTLRDLGRISTDAAGVAARLGKSESTVSRMSKRGELRPVQVGSRRRYPLWQVEGGAVVPRVESVCAAADRVHLHPLSVDGFMRAEVDVLGGTPLQWLIDGGAPEPVVSLIDALHR